MTGKTVSHYQIIEQIGAGGMGVVYRAEDVKLRRTVALKFLSTGSLAGEESKSRFLHEAQAAAALEHPHICGVYEIDEAEGRLFMAMPFVEGQSLDARISRGPRPLPELLEVAIQICEALEEAHSKKIVHRDIKPANIMISERSGGRLHSMLMDFGLARLSQATKLTREGSQLGTAAYMSPEQAQGAAVDHRTDIWALGVVLYEMTAGRLPFAADYEQALFYGILNETPEPLTALRTGVPMELERITSKCLGKRPEDRYQSCTDLLVDLRTLKKTIEESSRPAASRPALSAGPQDAPPATVAPARPWGRWQIALVAGFAAISALLALALWRSGGSAPAEPEASSISRFELARITWEGQLSGMPALSPDGRLLAYASDRGGGGNIDIWVQQVDGGSMIRVTSHPADDLQPSFSPDGTKLVYFRVDGGIYLIPALGGDPYLVAQDGESPSFGPDGATVAFRKRGRLYISPVSMGEPTELLAGFEEIGPPLWSPDGSRVLALARRAKEPADWWAAPIDGSEPKALGAREAFQAAGMQMPYPETWSWSGAGPLLGSDGELFRVPLDTQSWKFSGLPEQLTFGSGVEALPSGSSDGKIAFMDVRQRRDVWTLPLDHRSGAATGEPRRLSEAESSDTSSDISPDGKRLVYISNRWGHSDLWAKNLETGKEANLSGDNVSQRYPVLSADSERIAYLTRESGKAAIYVRPFEGGIGRRICDDCGPPRSWSRDLRFLLYDDEKNGSVGALDVDSGKTSAVVAAEGRAADMGRISPDGQWVAFRVDGSAASSGLAIAPFRTTEAVKAEEWISVSSHASDEEPAWSPDGRILYFTSSREGSRDIWMQRLDAATKQPAGEPRLVRRFPSIRHSIGMMTAEDRRLAATRDGLIFPMSELGGAVWLMTPK